MPTGVLHNTASDRVTFGQAKEISMSTEINYTNNPLHGVGLKNITADGANLPYQLIFHDSCLNIAISGK